MNFSLLNLSYWDKNLDVCVNTVKHLEFNHANWIIKLNGELLLWLQLWLYLGAFLNWGWYFTQLSPWERCARIRNTVSYYSSPESFCEVLGYVAVSILIPDSPCLALWILSFRRICSQVGAFLVSLENGMFGILAHWWKSKCSLQIGISLLEKEVSLNTPLKTGFDL